MVGLRGNNSEEETVDPAAVRAGYKALLDDIAGNEDELADVHNPRLFGCMETNEELFEKVETPQEAVLDARVIKQLSRLCRQQAEQMSANINQFRQQEFAEKLVSNMTGGEAGATVSKRKWVLLGKQVKGMFRRSPPLSYLYGALDTTPPPPKEQKVREPKAKQATRIKDLVATKDTVLEEAEKSENQTEQMVTHVLKCLVARYKVEKRSVNFFKFVIDPDSFGSTVENLFHVSFLIKDGRVDISIDEESGLPHIVPLSKKKQEGEDDEETKNQVVMNFCINDWQKLKDGLGIKSCMIEKMSLPTTEANKRPRH